MEKALKVLFVSPEVVPFAKSGGLADVAGSLPGALKKAGVDVRVIMPFYGSIRNKNYRIRPLIKDLSVPVSGMHLKAGVFQTRTEDRVPVYLIEREDLYERPNLYGNYSGDYYDNLERFSFFCHASILTALKLGFRPDIIHTHDWQTGLIAPLLKGYYSDEAFFSATKTVFTIHNMGYQGIFNENRLPATGLENAGYFHPDGFEYWGNLNLLKSGIVYSDIITTVSPTYAAEIQTKEYGMGMEGVLESRKDRLFGILNGIDYKIWNPSTDKNIPKNYSLKRLSGKSACKEALLKEMELDPILKDRPVFGMVTRLDKQKGLDIVLSIINRAIRLDAGFVLLGSGDVSIEKALKKAALKHNGKIGIGTGFNDPLAHKIIAGSDIFMIPSRYEPCGLTQMYALKYGTIPLVRSTGGLNDTVTEYNPETGTGNGFKFTGSAPGDLLRAVKNSVLLYENKEGWKKLIINAMKEDFSWRKSAEEYVDVYFKALHH